MKIISGTDPMRARSDSSLSALSIGPLTDAKNATPHASVKATLFDYNAGRARLTPPIPDGHVRQMRNVCDVFATPDDARKCVASERS
jgi:hypothetical protein